MTRLRVNFSHLKEHKFKHNFQDMLNSLCPCSLEAWHTYPFYIGCQIFSNQLNILFVDLNEISSDILKISENVIVRVSIFGKKVLLKIWVLGLLYAEFVSLKIVSKERFGVSFFFLRENFLTYFHVIKSLKYFFTFCISVL